MVEQPFAILREVLTGEPSFYRWSNLLDILFDWPDSSSFSLAFQYAEEHLQTWPDELRLISPWLLAELSGRRKRKKFELRHPLWQLARSLAFGGGLDFDWKHLRQFEQLKILRLWHTPADEVDWKVIAGFSQLEELSLEHLTPPASAVEWGRLEEIPQLKRLYLKDVPFKHVQWSSISQLRGLEELQLDHLMMTEIDWQALGRLTGLKKLSLQRLRIDLFDWSSLLALPQLESLHLEELLRCHVDWDTLSTLKRLKHFTLRELPVGDFSWQAVGELEALHTLHLEHLPITAVDWDALDHLSSLRSLYLCELPLQSLGDMSTLLPLRELGLVRCALRSCTIPPGLSRLRALDLSGNRSLSYLDVREAQELQTLSLQECRVLREIRGATSILYGQSTEDAPTHPHFVVIAGEELGRAFSVEGNCVFGRVGGEKHGDPIEGSFFEMKCMSISPVHCRVDRTGDVFIIRDLQSLEGTSLNGERVTEAVLRHGDCVELGRILLQWRQPS
tara:strand:- start:3927 stop:5438 length:1512 start_codon:yes stop_codon:yes gene_type:complete